MSTGKWEGKTILHHSVWNGHIEGVKLLLDRKFDPNISVEHPGEIPEELPLHIFDPRKDGVTALDIVCLRLSGLDTPLEIARGGFLEVQKWSEDLEQIKSLLLETGGRGILYDNIKEVIYSDSQAVNQASIVNNLLLKDGEVMTGSWPKPFTEMPTSSTAKTKEEILADTRIRDDAFHNVMRSDLQQRQMERRRELEKEATPKDYLQLIKSGATLRKHEWRLPPDWYCVSLTENKNKPGSYSALYVYRKSGEITSERPELYRGDRNFGSEKGKEKLVEDDIYGATPIMKPIVTSPEPDITALSLYDSDRSSDCGPSSMQPLEAKLPSNKTTDVGPSRAILHDSEGLDLTTATIEQGIVQFPRDITRLKYRDGSTMLHMAAQVGQLEFLSQFLEAKSISVDSERHDGCTPLHVAVDEGELDALALLLAYGADPNRIFPRRGHRPIHHSTFQGSADMANVLIQGGADVNATTAEGYVPLHFCVATGDKAEILELLLEAGADANAVGPEGSVLKMAVSSGRETSLGMLLNAGARANEDENLLHVAAQGRSTTIVEALLDRGLDVNKRDDSSQTPIIAAIVYQHFEVLRLLCERGADISVVEEFQFFLRPRDDGKIERMGMHVGRGTHLSAQALNNEFNTDDGMWEDWQPIKITKVEGKEDSASEN
ncbi:hypothetical protein HD806DRAFT_510917, partial [Xylariaceae sp. AK1471]